MLVMVVDSNGYGVDEFEALNAQDALEQLSHHSYGNSRCQVYLIPELGSAEYTTFTLL